MQYICVAIETKAFWGPQSFKSTKGAEGRKFENHCCHPMSITKVETQDT